MASVIPVAKALYLCDEILSDPARVKPHLIGVLNAVHVPAFPHALARLCVFAILVNGYGDVRCRIRVVSAHDRELLYESPARVVRFNDRRQTRYYSHKLSQIIVPTAVVVQFDSSSTTIRAVERSNCTTTPTAGEFWVELYCNDQFMDDATLVFFE